MTATVDTSGIDYLLDRLTAQDNARGMHAALLAGARVLAEATRQELVARAPEMARHTDGVRVKEESSCEVKVHIMGHYKLKWWETGTNDRWTKKGAYRGYIEPRSFFAAARLKSAAAVEDEITHTLDIHFNRIN